MAATAIAFARYFRELVPLPVSESALAAIALSLLTIVNCLGVKLGSRVQSVLMLLKIAAIALAMKQTDSAGAHNADQLRQRVLIHNELARREMPLGHRVRQSVSFARRKVAEQVDLADIPRTCTWRGRGHGEVR